MFAVLHLADFALYAVLRTEPGAEGRPAALLDPARKNAALLACNAAARAQGVAAGQTAAQARAYCGGLLVRPRSVAAEAEARAALLAALLAAAFMLSPRVEYTADGVCTADLAGLDPARVRVLSAAAVARLHAQGLPVAAGLAATPLLALYAARAAVPQAPVLRVDEPRAFLAPLPLATADPGPELSAVLAAWGIHTLGALTALPKAEVARRLGAAGLALWERAAGEGTRVLRLVEPSREFSAAMEFEEPVETLEPLLFILRRFVDRLALELETAHLAAAGMDLLLELDPAGLAPTLSGPERAEAARHARAFRLPEPATRPDILFRALHTHLESLRTEAAITAVRLRIKPTGTPHRQQGLFETALRDPHGFAGTLARLVAIAGSGRVGTPYVQDTHRPDAVVLEPPAAVVPPAQVQSGSPEPLAPAPGLPLRRWRPPAPARVVLDDQQHPASVWSAAVSGAVVVWRGPWRGAGDWWEVGRAWEREEWDVEIAGDRSGLYRLIRTPGGWFVEGEYD